MVDELEEEGRAEGFGVGYNVQTAVDAESHIVTGYNVTNRPTDHGLITQTAMEVKEDYGTYVLETGIAEASRGRRSSFCALPSFEAPPGLAGLAPASVPRRPSDAMVWKAPAK